MGVERKKRSLLFYFTDLFNLFLPSTVAICTYSDKVIVTLETFMHLYGRNKGIHVIQTTTFGDYAEFDFDLKKYAGWLVMCRLCFSEFVTSNMIERWIIKIAH